ncbi:MAG: molybdenum cofactor biosynthesis protein MoaE [Spirochaetaceae bacterium]|nr:molybdenum cofactor biosynthesis protein MoaE [Myxococcales bacterium]MCB9724453.1 molybdenum cofactor biosynthesis protein MoaE [Spirochaetaceae bacterium]HPG25892.1 molybdenum cofactor biosynthesis protein MoaE [Myxococcota bacterium]
MPRIKITLKLFGSLREAAGDSTLRLELDEGARVCDLREQLAARLPLVQKLGDRLAASVNLEIADPDDVLEDGDEVAFLPPVAGGDGAATGSAESGARRCTISDAPLDEAEVAARVEGPDAGGVVSFVGRVRDHARGHSIEHLEYEAYPEMAEREMEKIADEAGARWPGTRVAIAHRVGHLAIGDAAVVVVAASAHRAEAFEACRFAIDTLKVRVPIWKREVATDGAYWVDDHA